MGTAERHKASGSGEAVEAAARGVAPREVGAVRRETGVAPREVGVTPREEARPGPRPPLWVEEPARRRRLPDPVRTAAVRAVIIVAVTLVQAMVAFLAALAGSWLSFPMVLSSVASTVVATWGVLDVWVTRQVWNQRHGVVSMPSSTARRLRRERRRARRQARVAARGKEERIRRRPGQLSHP
ncbi:hypothetical protein [Streptomyces alboniger]|uniref:Uncharacterized protein n=1 Tax=Streptomyces alboniger TaxID=132473 RepID=A0A5J6HUV0_STRAD|nr:hypothetical protein [Streptomyces alboniger]QEV22110.1 hypothetical protein CP975_05085 [Streptomyces alboniger]